MLPLVFSLLEKSKTPHGSAVKEKKEDECPCSRRKLTFGTLGNFAKLCFRMNKRQFCNFFLNFPKKRGYTIFVSGIEIVEA